MLHKIFTLATFIAAIFLISHSAMAQDRPEDRVKVEIGRSAEQYYNIGNWYSNRQQHYKAIAYYKAAIKKDNRYDKAMINLAASYRAVQRYDEAVAALEKAISLKTNIKDVYLNLGNTYIAAGRLREATIALRTYTELQQYDPAGYYRLAFALYSLKEYEEAAATFEKLILIDKTAHNYYQTARCYAKLKNYDKTLEKSLLALQADPVIRFVIMEEADFKDFRSSAQFRSLLAEMNKLKK